MDKQLTDPREIRQLLQQVAWGIQRVDGKDCSRTSYSQTGGIVHQIYTMCDVRGLSGEDKFTLLAYHALLMFEKAIDMKLEQAMLNPAPHFFVPRPKHDEVG